MLKIKTEAEKPALTESGLLSFLFVQCINTFLLKFFLYFILFTDTVHITLCSHFKLT